MESVTDVVEALALVSAMSAIMFVAKMRIGQQIIVVKIVGTVVIIVVVVMMVVFRTLCNNGGEVGVVSETLHTSHKKAFRK